MQLTARSTAYLEAKVGGRPLCVAMRNRALCVQAMQALEKARPGTFTDFKGDWKRWLTNSGGEGAPFHTKFQVDGAGVLCDPITRARVLCVLEVDGNGHVRNVPNKHTRKALLMAKIAADKEGMGVLIIRQRIKRGADSTGSCANEPDYIVHTTAIMRRWAAWAAANVTALAQAQRITIYSGYKEEYLRCIPPPLRDVFVVCRADHAPMPWADTITTQEEVSLATHTCTYVSDTASDQAHTAASCCELGCAPLLQAAWS